MKSFQRMVLCLIVGLLIVCYFSIPAKAHSGYDYTSNSTVAEVLSGILNGSISIFNDGKGYAVGSSIGSGTHYFGGTSGSTCWAYANAVYYKLFGSVPENSGVNVVGLIGTSSVSYNSLLSAGVKCGTYMRTEGNGGHSIIILSYNSSNISWLDANWNQDGVIKIHTNSYSYFNTWYINYKGRKLSRVIIPNYADKEYSTLQFDRVAYPRTFKIDTYNGWHLTGGIVASNVALTQLKSEILTSSGALLSQHGPIPISGKSFSIPSIDSSVKFSQIKQEGDYIWRLTATDSSNRTLTMDMPVHATNSGYTEPATMSKEYVDVKHGSEMTSGYDRTIPDGDYIIAIASNPLYYLDIYGGEKSASNGDNVVLCQANDMDGVPDFDVWTVIYNSSDKFYTIRQKTSNMCLDVTGASTAEKTNVEAYQANSSSAQKWAISLQGKNGYRIQAKCSGFSLDASAISNGSNVYQYTSHDGDNQAWVFIPYKPSQPISNGRYIILSALNRNYEVDVEGDTGSVNNMTNVRLWDTGALSQYNSFDITKLSNGYYKIIHAASGKSLDVNNGGSAYRQNIGLYDDHGGLTEQWAITPNGNGYVVRPRNSGYAMDVASLTAASNGLNIKQEPYHGKPNQTWYFVPAEQTVSYNANGGTGAPANQIKYYGNALTLSKTVPTRKGYTFLGWATSASATAATYQPGASYTTDAALTLYAVWKSANGTCGTNLKWSIDKNVLTISGTGAMADYTQNNQPWRDYQASITKLDIKSGVTSIGQYAFYNMSALKEIVIPGTVKDIKYRAFLYCRSITQVTIPEGVQSIAFDAFAGCTQLQAIHFPDSLISLGGMAYQGARVSQVELGPGLKTIGGNPFCCDPNLTRFTVKEGAAIKVMDNSLYSLDGTRMVAYPCGHSATQYTVPMGTVILDDYCFYGITNLKEITVPDGVTKIGQYAFHKDTCLQKIYLPDSITDIGEEAFGGCTNLTIYCYNGSFAQQYAASNGIPYVIMSIPSGTCGDNLTWQIKSNVLTISGTGKMADYGDDSQPWHDSAASITKVVINDGVTSIGNSAFHGMQVLKEVSVPDSLQSIGNRAFRLCTNLPNLDLPDTVTHIGSTVFDGCYAFTGFRIPKGVKVISERMFDSCRSIKEHAIPSGVQTIKNQAFAWNKSLEKIIIPPSVTSIADDAFVGCEQVVIHCKDQSAAHKYAIKNNIPFVILDNSTVFDTPEYTGIEMDQTELAIRIGETYTLKANAVPDSASLEKVEWVSSAPDVAEVSSGEIRAVAEGMATITCYSVYEPSIKAECVVKVVEEHLTLSETDCTLKQGEVLNLQVKLQAFEGNTTKLVWTHDDGIEFDYKESSNGGEVSLYGLTPGVYHATCQTEDGRLSVTCTINIIPAEIDRVVLNNETLDLLGGEMAVLSAKVEPYYAYNEGFNWSTNDTGIAAVDSSGLVMAVGPGNTTITCAAASAPEKTASCRVTVTVPVSSVVLNRSVYEFGDASEGSIELTATLSPDNASNKSITWSSSNTHVATVLDGIVTPNAPGYARITCESVDGPKGVCDIVVHAEKIRKLPSSLKAIEAETFFGTALREVMIPDGVTSIESKAFANCGQLVLVDMPLSVSSIASDAFSSSNVTIVCSEVCYVTEYADNMGIPYVIGSMPGEVIISTDSTTLLTGQSATLQARVLPNDAPKAVRWSIIDGGDIATIKSNGNKCTLTAVSAGRVTVSGTAINNTTGTIDITIIDHPTGFGIMFDANGGSVSTGSRSADFDVPLGTLPVPTREYYSFDGWYTLADGGTEVKADTVFNDYFMGDITLYAHWTRKVCTITYDANGGSCGTSSKSMNQGDAIGTLPTATRNYYTFDGWYTQASGGTKVAATTVFSSDTKLYAHWTRKTCTITFNANGGSCGTASKTMNQGEAIGTLPTAMRDYYNFDGWYTQASGGTKATTTTVYSSNTTLYAHWTDKSWSGWVEASQLPSGNILTEKKTQYRYQDASYGGWSAWSGWDITRQGTSDVKKEESATVWYWYRFVCPYCGAHMHVWDKCHTWAGGCGKRIGSENYNVLWSTMPPSAGIQNWEGTGRIMDGGTPKNRWFFWKDASQGYPNGRSETGYRYATRTKSWGAWTSWSDTAVTGSSTRNVQTRTVYRYKVM